MDLEDIYRLLRAGHIQAQGIVDTLDEPLLVLDENLAILSGNAAFFETFCVSKDETLGKPIYSLGDGQWNIPELRKLLSDVVPRSRAVVGYEVKHDFPRLGVRTMLVSARRLVHPDSSSTSMLLVFEDVTDDRRKVAETDILLAEARHRMKNLLAIVRALASQTATEGRSAVEYRSAFLGRVEAVMVAQDGALSGRSTADFAEIVGRAAELARSKEALVCHGPSVTLAPPQVLPLNLVMHELTTNALKYGALSMDGGTVTITWSVTVGAGGGDLLQINWNEANGPRVTPPERSGFGSRLIEFSIKQELGGTAELQFDPEGFHGSFSVPIG